MTFAEKLKELRQSRALTAREFCQKYEFDPGNWSRLENGKVRPPSSDEVLRSYAKALGLRNGSSGWHDFFDTAYAENGTIPPDLMEDAEFVSRLPNFFSLVRNNGVRKIFDGE